MSKPNQALYQLTYDKIRTAREDASLEKKHIIHVGDNPISDIAGAENFGFQSFHINTNHQIISDLIH